jgi:hypothetical protein
MRNTIVKQLTRILVLAVVSLGVLGTGPGVAGACACGAVLADERLNASHESALVELDGTTESITLNVTTQTVATDAAFLMPVPARAAFELADTEVFAELDTISAPRVEYSVEIEEEGNSGGGAAPGGDHVTVTDHTTVGPFEVAQLGGTDAGAVATWLGGHGFELPDELAGALTPYLAEGWLVVAVRLTPDAAGATFADGLPTMRLTFDTTEPVYPMRLSATAETIQPLRLYVLADHRVSATDPSDDGGLLGLTYADWVRPGDLADQPLLAHMVDEPRFLTRYDDSFAPDEITADVRLTRLPVDETYRAVVHETSYVSLAPVEDFAPLFLILLVVIVVPVALEAGVRRPRRAAKRSSTMD